MKAKVKKEKELLTRLICITQQEKQGKYVTYFSSSFTMLLFILLYKAVKEMCCMSSIQMFIAHCSCTLYTFA